MFEEAHPSEVVSAYLPLLHDIWSSIKRLRDADFDKTRDVFLQGTAMHVTQQTKQKGRHNPRDCFRRCRNIKESTRFGADTSQTLSLLTPQHKLQDHTREVQRCDLVSA